MTRNVRIFIKVLFAVLFCVFVVSMLKNYHYLAYFSSTLLALLGYVLTFYFLRQNVRLKRRIRNSILMDSNTKLPNRYRFLSDQKKFNKPYDATLIVINIDSFQQTNAYYGDHFGDTFLQTMARWISNNLPPVECRLYKFEADIYTIFVKGPFSEYELMQYLKKLSLDITTDCILCEEIRVETTLSIGAAQAKKNLLELAFIACKEARVKRLPYVIYDKDSDKDEQSYQNITINQAIKDALTNNSVIPFFQPIMNLHTHKIQKFETLMRIEGFDGKIYQPKEFLEIAKHSKIYSKLSMSLIQKVFETSHTSYNRFSINLSYLDIINPDTTSFILEKLEEFSIGPFIIFEILESDSIDNYEALVSFIDQVKSYGAKIAIDDFGAGYSNFERLTKLDIDFIKIDGSLIKNIDKNEEAKIIVETIVTFAKKLGIATIAEYVHSRQILECVKELGIDFAQGFYIGKPKDTPTTVLEPSIDVSIAN